MPASLDSARKPIVLIVDDSPEMTAVLNALLGQEYTTKTADNGEEAVRIARADPPPDLVLLDVVMPGLDGYEVCRMLQEDATTRDIPIIFLSAKSDAEDEAKGFNLGAVDYITKPISFPIVTARVRNTLALARKTATLRTLSDKLSRYLPPQVTAAIFAGARDARIETKRKELTVFFSDLKGFTELAERLEPGDLTWLLNDYFTEMFDIALAHGATMDKFIGDAMLIFVGDPQTLGAREDALQCVRMAAAMQRRMAVLESRWRAKGLISQPLQMRIGINTGFCDVGNFGSLQRMDYTVIGTQVNVAARLEQECAPGGILLSHATHELVKEEIACVERTPFRAKGIARDIRCFAVPVSQSE